MRRNKGVLVVIGFVISQLGLANQLRLAKADEAGQAALQTIPADALAFIMVPSLAGLDADYQLAVKTLGLESLMPPESRSLVGMLKQQFPMFKDMDEAGSLSVIILPMQNIFEIQYKQVVAIPAKNPRAIIEALGGQGGDDNLFTTLFMGQPAVLGIKGGYVLLGYQNEAVKHVRDSKENFQSNMKGPERKAIDGLDVVLWINAEKLFEMVRPMLDSMLGPMFAMQQAQGGFAGKSAQANKEFMDNLVDGSKTLLFGIAMDKEGFRLRSMGMFKRGSQLAKQYALHNTQESLLKGLPADDFVFAAGQTCHPEQALAAMKSLDPWLMPEDAQAPYADALKKIRGQLAEFVPMIKLSRFVISPLISEGDGIVNFSMLLDVTDSRKSLALMKQLMESGREAAGKIGVQGARGQRAEGQGAGGQGVGDQKQAEMVEQVLAALSYESGAEKISGVDVDHFKLDLSKFEDIEEEVEEIKPLIGKEGLLVRLAAADGDTVAIAFGGGKARMEQLIQGAKSDSSEIEQSAGVKAVAEHLARDRASVSYVALNHTFVLVNNILKAMEEEPLPAKAPKVDTPLAMSFQGSDEWGQFDVFVPAKVLEAGKDILAQLMGTQQQPADAG